MSAAFPEHPVRLCRQTGLLDTHLDDLDTECGQQLVAAAVRRWAAKTGQDTHELDVRCRGHPRAVLSQNHSCQLRGIALVFDDGHEDGRVHDHRGSPDSS